MVKVTCPNCAADIEVPPDAPIHTCDYCGTAIQVNVLFGGGGTPAAGGQPKEQYVIKDHYIIRCHYPQQQAKNLLVDWVKKIPGAPQDFEDAANISSMKLTFYPIWVGEYGAVSDYVGLDDWPQFSRPAPDRPGWFEAVTYYKKEERGRVIREYQIPLIAVPSEKLPAAMRDYVVTTTGKEYFDIQHVKKLGGQIMDSTFNMEQAKGNMRQQVLNRQESEMHKEVTQITGRNDDIKEKGVFYIHFPVYNVEFTYNNKPHTAIIDGSTGRIIYVKVPVSTAFRVKTIGACAAFAAVGACFLLVLGLSSFLFGTAIVPGYQMLGIVLGICFEVVGCMFFGLNVRKQASEKAR